MKRLRKNIFGRIIKKNSKKQNMTLPTTKEIRMIIKDFHTEKCFGLDWMISKLLHLFKELVIYELLALIRKFSDEKLLPFTCIQ